MLLFFQFWLQLRASAAEDVVDEQVAGNDVSRYVR